VYALDGNAYYARPGPRLLQGCGIIARLLHGDAAGDAIGEDISPRDSWTVVTAPPSPAEMKEEVTPAAAAAAASVDVAGAEFDAATVVVPSASVCP